MNTIIQNIPDTCQDALYVGYPKDLWSQFQQHVAYWHYNFQSLAFTGLSKRNPGGGGALPGNRLMGVCHWMGSHFLDWIDCNGVAFSIELLEWGRIFSGFGGQNIQANREFVY